MDYIEVSAKTIEEATSQATAQIESQGRVVTSVKVLEEPSKGFLGFGKKDALVRVYFEEGTAENIAVAEEVVSVVETVTETTVDTVETEAIEIPVVVEDGITKAEQDFIADTGKDF